MNQSIMRSFHIIHVVTIAKHRYCKWIRRGVGGPGGERLLLPQVGPPPRRQRSVIVRLVFIFSYVRGRCDFDVLGLPLVSTHVYCVAPAKGRRICIVSSVIVCHFFIAFPCGASEQNRRPGGPNMSCTCSHSEMGSLRTDPLLRFLGIGATGATGATRVYSSYSNHRFPLWCVCGISWPPCALCRFP